MTLYRCFQPWNGLPDPKGLISSIIPSQAVAQANQDVVDATQSRMRKRGPYQQYTAKDWAEIGMYTCNYVASAATCIFSLQLGLRLNESMARSMKQMYVEGCCQKRRIEDDGEVAALPPKKHGRPLLLGQDLDAKVQVYLRNVRETGGAVSARIAMAAARGIMLFCDRSRLVEFGGHVQLSRFWAHALLKEWSLSSGKQPLPRGS